jgi:hypothetical protein
VLIVRRSGTLTVPLSVCWDADAKDGVVRIDDETEDDLKSFAPAWPDWRARADELQVEISDHSPPIRAPDCQRHAA